MKYFLSIATVLIITAFALHGETIRFRSGNILAAEMSAATISIANTNPDMPLNIPQKPLYVVISVKLDSMRSISMFDYTLEAFGTEYKCAAINTGKRFEYTDATLSSGNVIQLLFIADNLIAGKLPEEKMTLKSNFTPKKTYDITIPVTKMSRLTPPGSIPVKGAFKSWENAQ